MDNAPAPTPALVPSIKQRETLQYIVDSIRSRGMPPTLRELADALDVASTESVRVHLRALERKKLLKLGRRQCRALQPTNDGWAAVS